MLERKGYSSDFERSDRPMDSANARVWMSHAPVPTDWVIAIDHLKQTATNIARQDLAEVRIAKVIHTRKRIRILAAEQLRHRVGAVFGIQTTAADYM